LPEGTPGDEELTRLVLEKFQDAGFSGVLVCPAGYVAVHQQILERKLELADHEKMSLLPKGSHSSERGRLAAHAVLKHRDS